MRSFYGEASNQGAAMPGKMPAEVLTPGKSSPRCYLDYAARADTSLAKGVAILRQLPSITHPRPECLRARLVQNRNAAAAEHKQAC